MKICDNCPRIVCLGKNCKYVIEENQRIRDIIIKRGNKKEKKKLC
jgi:hypothetical protein